MAHIEASSTFFPAWVRSEAELSLPEADVMRALEGMLKGEQYRRDGNTIQVFPRTQMFAGGSYQALYQQIDVTVVAINDQYSRIEYQFMPRGRVLAIASLILILVMVLFLLAFSVILMGDEFELGLLFLGLPLIILVVSVILIFSGNRKGGYHKRFEKTFLRQLTRYGLIIKESRPQM